MLNQRWLLNGPVATIIALEWFLSQMNIYMVFHRRRAVHVKYMTSKTHKFTTKRIWPWHKSRYGIRIENIQVSVTCNKNKFESESQFLDFKNGKQNQFKLGSD
uniref:Uncharacterized protein n=1 Tax=Cacopsylla melanoneura TaxID=428564 RepID=A0A8D8Q5Z9_9HEMI